MKPPKNYDNLIGTPAKYRPLFTAKHKEGIIAKITPLDTVSGTNYIVTMEDGAEVGLDQCYFYYSEPTCCNQQELKNRRIDISPLPDNQSLALSELADFISEFKSVGQRYPDDADKREITGYWFPVEYVYELQWAVFEARRVSGQSST